MLLRYRFVAECIYDREAGLDWNCLLFIVCHRGYQQGRSTCLFVLNWQFHACLSQLQTNSSSSGSDTPSDCSNESMLGPSGACGRCVPVHSFPAHFSHAPPDLNVFGFAIVCTWVSLVWCCLPTSPVRNRALAWSRRISTAESVSAGSCRSIENVCLGSSVTDLISASISFFPWFEHSHSSFLCFCYVHHALDCQVSASFRLISSSLCQEISLSSSCSLKIS